MIIVVDFLFSSTDNKSVCSIPRILPSDNPTLAVQHCLYIGIQTVGHIHGILWLTKKKRNCQDPWCSVVNDDLIKCIHGRQ